MGHTLLAPSRCSSWSLSEVQRVAQGDGFRLALKTDGTLWAWGYNATGELGDGSVTSRSVPVQILTGVTAMEAGAFHSLAVRSDSTVWAWGDNGVGPARPGPGPRHAHLHSASLITSQRPWKRDFR